jgi:dihydrolipoamide dehydrogenase
VDKKTNVILGVHMITPQAGEQIGEGVLFLENKLKVDLIRRVSRFYPSYSSAFKEAANSAFELN